MILSSHPKVEFRTAISPSEQFVWQLRFLLESIRSFGGSLAAEADVVVVVGEDVPPFDLAEKYPWLNEYPVKFVWVDQERFQKQWIYASGLHRMEIKTDADVVILLDADTFVVGDLDSAILRSFSEHVFLGMIAHFTPFQGPELFAIPEQELWQNVFEIAGLPPIQRWTNYSFWGMYNSNPDCKICPSYFNFGVLITPRTYVDAIGSTMENDLSYARQGVDNRFDFQVALTISLARHEIPWDHLPVNYNFPLHSDEEKIRAMVPDREGKNAPQDVCIFHYLGDGEINRLDFSNVDSLKTMLARDGLSQHGTVCQSYLAQVWDVFAERDAAEPGKA
jgi:hypothetical protein